MSPPPVIFAVGDYAFAPEYPHTLLRVEHVMPDGRIVLQIGRDRTLVAAPERLRRPQQSAVPPLHFGGQS